MRNCYKEIFLVVVLVSVLISGTRGLRCYRSTADSGRDVVVRCPGSCASLSSQWGIPPCKMKYCTRQPHQSSWQMVGQKILRYCNTNLCNR